MTSDEEPKDREPDYAAAWDDLRSRQQWFFVAWLGGFVAVALLGQIKFLPWWIAPTAWAAAFFYTGIWWSSFLCPRCGKTFGIRCVCRYCGLKKYAETDADEETRYLRMYEQ